MRKQLLLTLSAVAFVSSASADCNFIYDNKTDHAVTLRGYFDNSDNTNPTMSKWVLVESNATTVQKITGNERCNDIFHHSGQLLARVSLQNGSGYWTGNKGFLFSTDRSYANIGASKAFADDQSEITLSNGIPVTAQEFKVMICDADVNSDDCN